MDLGINVIRFSRSILSCVVMKIMCVFQWQRRKYRIVKGSELPTQCLSNPLIVPEITYPHTSSTLELGRQIF